jgi:hypothetical protein
LPASIKVLQLIRTDGTADWAGEQDGELGRRIGAFRQVRNHLLEEAHGEDPTWLGARELWWPTLSAFQAGPPLTARRSTSSWPRPETRSRRSCRLNASCGSG